MQFLFTRPKYIFMQNDFRKEQYKFYVKVCKENFVIGLSKEEIYEHSILKIFWCRLKLVVFRVLLASNF